MSARLAPDPALRAMDLRDLDAVMALEARIYGFPWTRGNFIDSLAAGYLAEVLVAPEAGIVGYFVAMPGADEMHLLNLSVAPEWQGRGLGRSMLDALEAHCRTRRMATLWLEVRAGNERARALYRRRGFVEVGQRRGYYPAPRASREDAIVMRAELDPGTRDGLD
ncbi:MAG: ribosomal-protein-alanine N-acetyltransferase [Rubrivivax sp. SCN 70-15]|nr:MAG: ribosomal-protein-alanine N-acetyltransferase [Rubrivivax sp. SCN 70-15]